MLQLVCEQYDIKECVCTQSIEKKMTAEFFFYNTNKKCYVKSSMLSQNTDLSIIHNNYFDWLTIIKTVTDECKNHLDGFFVD